jgi:catechol 2,3-dioxygenase-like lactoylglutathione lyase family enzyme
VIVTVPDLAAALHHWRPWGYRAGASGELSAAAASRLYGHASALRALRLEHGVARNGRIRLWQWADVRGPGLALAALRVPGSRWSVHRTHNITPALAWAASLERAAHSVRGADDVRIVGPVTHAHGDGAASINLAVLTAQFRHVVLVRHGIDVPRYGTPSPDALLGTSEVCHAGLVLPSAARASLPFYEALGLRRVSERRVLFDPRSVATQMFPLRPGEALREIDFDDPSAGPGPAQLPGRLRVFMLERDAPLGPASSADAADATVRPGDLGYGPYVVARPAALAPMIATGATVLAEEPDEFGGRCARVAGPDGQTWLLTS